MTEDILDLIEELKIPGESYYLEALEYSGEETGLGDLDKTWSQKQELTGVIQKASRDSEGKRGLEEEANYEGFFHSDFDIPQKNSGEYRIVNIISTPDGDFTRYFRIREINRNLTLENARVYCEMQLQLAKKW